MGNIPLLLHSSVNLVSLVSTIWPGFFLPLGITTIIIAIVGLFGELSFFQWISVYYIEAFASMAFAALVCLIMVIVKLFIFGTYKIRIAEDLGKLDEKEENEIKKVIEETEIEEIDMGLILNFLKWSYTKIRTIRVDVYLFKGWNWLVILWLLAINIYAAVDFFGFHFLTSVQQDWIFGVVVLSVALLFFIVGSFLTWWVLWIDHRDPLNSIFSRRKRKDRSKSIRGENVWTMEVIAYIMQIPIFKGSLVFSYWLFFRYYNYSERISLLIGLGFFVVVDGLLIVLLKILKRWIGGRIMYSPEEMEVKKKDIELLLQKK